MFLLNRDVVVAEATLGTRTTTLPLPKTSQAVLKADNIKVAVADNPKAVVADKAATPAAELVVSEVVAVQAATTAGETKPEIHKVPGALAKVMRMIVKPMLAKEDVKMVEIQTIKMDAKAVAMSVMLNFC